MSDDVKSENSRKILSDVVVYNKYARYLPKKKRRETYAEITERYKNMMLEKYKSFPDIVKGIKSNIKFIEDKKILPSMRAMQFAGAAIEKNESRIYNCAFLPIDDYRAFSEAMFLLLGGTGVGYSVQFSHVDQLPEIKKPNKEQKYVVGDNIEGWADAVRHLMASYLGLRSTKPRFDFSDIREKGTRLVTAGGKAPGPEPLKVCLVQVQAILNNKKDGQKLTTLECHDILCHIADAVLAGGIRRAAMISLFSADDNSMLTCKYGNWWELNPQRGRANNSAVLVRHRVDRDSFLDLWKRIEESGSGEPGIYFTNNKDWGTNPCCEIALRPYQFCNLCEVNVSDIKSQEDLNERVAAAAFFGTLQAGFTDFHYLRDVWKKTTEKDALIGVGMTGIASGEILKYSLKEASEITKETNKATAHFIGIKEAARVNTIKPSGSTSCVLGTSSGIHAWYDQHYIRRMQMTKDEDLYKYLVKSNPNLVDDYHLIPNSAVIEIPQKAPSGSILRTESALDLLERIRLFNIEWVREGHRHGDNTNNVSATVSIKPEEWGSVGTWMWNNRDTFNGLSVLPYDSGSYKQAPFETITEEEYNEKVANLNKINLKKVVEEDDSTSLSDQAACAGGACEIT